MREQRTKAQVKKKTKNPQKQKLQDNTPTLLQISHPHLPYPPIICNNNTMDIKFLVQMRQSHKCGSVRNDDIFNLQLGSGVMTYTYTYR